MPVVCVRVDTGYENWSGWSDLDRDPISATFLGLWRGTYNGYGSVEEAPDLSGLPSDEYFKYADILVHAAIWDNVVAYQKGQTLRRLEKHPEYQKYYQKGRTSLTRAWWRQMENRHRLWRSFGSGDFLDDRANLEELLAGTFYEPGLLWPLWLEDIGWVMDFAGDARINLLASTRNRGQHNELGAMEFLSSLTDEALQAVRERIQGF
jgi:hypothetical protein